MPIPSEQKLVPVAITLRDKLLNRNLLLSDTVTLYGSTTWASGIDKPAEIGLSNDSIIPSEDITVNGELYRNANSNLIFNRYKNTSSTKDVLGGLTYDNSQYLKSYLAEYGTSDIDNNLLLNSETLRNDLIRNNQYRKFEELTTYTAPIGNLPQNPTTNESYIDKRGGLAGSSTFEMAGNVIGSVLNGQGVGFSPQGVEPNFDIRTTMAGRVLGMTGIIDDTPLGKAAQKGLAFAMLNNLAFNTQQEVGGMINTSVTNLMSGGNILVPNNDITVPKEGLGKATDLLQKLSGFEVPRSFLPQDASIYCFDDKLTLIQNDGRNQSIIDNTGKGQQIALFRNLNANLLMGWYGPNYIPSKDGITYSGSGTDILTYPTGSTSYTGLKEIYFQEDFVGITPTPTEFTWPGESGNADIDEFPVTFETKSLLGKTQELFKGGKNRNAKTMINSLSEVNPDPYDELMTISNEADLISKGNAVINKDGKTFCRTWSTLKRYDKVSSLQKNRGLDNGSKESVLDANGFVRIGPTHGQGGSTDMKRFMFSLENLAWSDSGSFENLRECEKGPGDGLSGGKRGRIMWFPPYNLTFGDTTNVNWESTDFIGRGEPIYTYNNTERTGQLSFKILTDHSSAYNRYRNESNEVINRFIFGCETLPAYAAQNISTITQDKLAVEKAKNEAVTTKVDDVNINLTPLSFYFPNDIPETPDGSPYTQNYEVSGTELAPTEGIGEYYGEYSKKSFINQYDTGLNIPFYSGIDKFVEEIKKTPSAIINIKGYASSHGTVANNKKLFDARAKNMSTYLTTVFGIPKAQISKVEGIEQIEVGSVPQDSLPAKKARKCDIYITVDPKKSILKPNPIVIKNSETDNTNLNSAIVDGLLCESSYFKYLEQSDPVSYAKITGSIKDQIQFFQPAFHSITPEGFNSRLNFLLQCTRQGPTIGKDKNITPSNLAFGKPPVCILRIGDFYHTKIIIDNVNFEFNEVQWDLNPDGIGVQPMIVDVSISFKFIGGSSLNGPIAKLQNAVSFNFFANTEMYDERADRLSNNGELIHGKINKTEQASNIETTNIEPVNVNQSNLNEEVNGGSNTQSSETSIDNDFNILKSMQFTVDTSYEVDSDIITVGMVKDGLGNLSKDWYGRVILIDTDTHEQIPLTNSLSSSATENMLLVIVKDKNTTEPFKCIKMLESNHSYTVKVIWDEPNNIKKSKTIYFT